VYGWDFGDCTVRISFCIVWIRDWSVWISFWRLPDHYLWQIISLNLSSASWRAKVTSERVWASRDKAVGVSEAAWPLLYCIRNYYSAKWMKNITRAQTTLKCEHMFMNKVLRKQAVIFSSGSWTSVCSSRLEGGKKLTTMSNTLYSPIATVFRVYTLMVPKPHRNPLSAWSEGLSAGLF